MITHIVALSSFNNAIGFKNKLPWHLPEDLKHFKKVTMGKTIVMGSNTFRSVVSYSKNNEVLPGREIVVISSTLENSVALYSQYSYLTNVKFATKKEHQEYMEVFKDEDFIIVGGSQLYAAYPPDVVIATIVYTGPIEADSFYRYPLLNSEYFEKTYSSAILLNDGQLSYSFCRFQKINK